MRHGSKNNNLSRTASHRKALLMNLGCQLITKTKKPDSKEAIMHNHRIVFSYLNDKAAVKELFTGVGPKISGRPGGYTRIIKLGARTGDNAELAISNWLTLTRSTVKEPSTKAAEPAKKTRRAGGAKKKTAKTEETTEETKTEE